MIVKNLQKKLNGKEIVKLNDLIEKNKNCKSVDPEDSLRLEAINSTLIKNFDREMKKAENFIHVFKSMKDDDPEKLYFIFDKYSPNEKEFSFTILNYFMYEYNQKEKEELLTKMRGEFQNLQSQTTPSLKKDA